MEIIHFRSWIFYHNGYGRDRSDQDYFWITGGLYFYSTNLEDVSIENNVFSKNRGFQIGYSEHFLKSGRTWQDFAKAARIRISSNLFDGDNPTVNPIRGGGNPVDRVLIFGAAGVDTKIQDVHFNDPAKQDFSTSDRPLPRWWLIDFPPKIGTAD